MSASSTINGSVRRWRQHERRRGTAIPSLADFPQHWQTKRIKHICLMNPSKAEIRGTAADLPVSFLPMEKVSEQGGLDLELIRPIGTVWQGFTYFRDGDVLVAKITPCFENGKGALAQGLENGIGFGTTELHVLRPKPLIAPRFLELVTRQHAFRNLGRTSMSGVAGQQRVSEAFISNFVVGIPPLEEQRRIVSFLDREMAKIDTLIAKKERLIELLQEKRVALISHAVTKGLDPTVPMKDSGNRWTGVIPQHWQLLPVRRIGKRVDVGIAEAATHAYRDVGVPIIRSTNIRRNQIDKNDLLFIDPVFADKNRTKYLSAGDLVTTRTGANLGMTAIVPPDLDSSQCFTLLVTTLRCGYEPRYFSYFMNSQAGQFYFSIESWGAGQHNLSVPIVKDMPVPVPPLDEQIRIVQYVERATALVDPLILRVGDAVEKLQEYRTALISAAVTGKIDVREEAVA